MASKPQNAVVKANFYMFLANKLNYINKITQTVRYN